MENIVVLCFERRCSKQNTVIRLKSSILAPPPKFLGWLRHCYGQKQPNQVFGIVLLKLDELSRQRFLCVVCLW